MKWDLITIFAATLSSCDPGTQPSRVEGTSCTSPCEAADCCLTRACAGMCRGELVGPACTSCRLDASSGPCKVDVETCRKSG